MYLKIQGLVTRVTAYNDTDSILTILSQDQGKLAVKARGLRRKNSPLIAPCQLLTFSEFTLFEYRGFYTINEARSIEHFHGLRKDLGKLSLGSYFAQICDVIAQEDIPNPHLLSLVLNSLYALNQLDCPPLLVKSVFELRCACLAGYTPDLSGCYRCGCDHADRFNIAEGRLECRSCKDPGSDGLRLPITAGTLDAMRYVLSCDTKRLFSFIINDDSIMNLSSVTEAYLETQLQQSFSALDFYKSLYLTN